MLIWSLFFNLLNPENDFVNSIGLRDVLTMAGAKVVDEKPSDNFIDLSPTALDKTTILKLMK